ncbi:MAG: SpoIIE family protein phosphatase [Thermodesulfobacteriota bacterium]
MQEPKILVVEDHPMSRKMLVAMLRQNYAMVAAASGEEAIALARDEKPDLVLLDVEMPDMDGFQTLEELRRGVIDEAVPVIFLTARTDSESRGKGLEAGAVDYLTKPYDRHELSIKVKNHLALYEARKEIEQRNRIMAQEMEMASQLQRSLLPQVFPLNDRLAFSVAYVPTLQASGDFYDVIELPNGRIGFAQVDVSGHGVHSAMIGAMFKMAFQTLTGHDASPARLLATINDDMFRVLPDSEFLTIFFGVIDTNSLEFVYSNGGHPKPFLYRAADQTIVELEDGGPLIGAFPGFDYDEGSAALESGDRILVFTDGVTEAGNGQDGSLLYGEERLRAAFIRSAQLPPSDAIECILADIKDFRGDSSFDDDVSMIIVAVR